MARDHLQGSGEKSDTPLPPTLPVCVRACACVCVCIYINLVKLMVCSECMYLMLTSNPNWYKKMEKVKLSC